ncbi:MAG: hypothetical protein R6W95_03340, partial [Desulfosarcina sp.]
FSCVSAPAALAPQLHRDLDEYVKIALAHRDHENPEASIRVALRDWMFSLADEAAAMLDGKSVKDFFIVRSGEYENAVSLGVFSGPERARSRSEQPKPYRHAQVHQRAVRSGGTGHGPRSVCRRSFRFLQPTPQHGQNSLLG